MNDRHGNPFSLGDSVVIRGTISSMQAGENDYCNVTVLTDVPMAGNPYYVTLNAKQTELTTPQPQAPIEIDVYL